MTREQLEDKPTTNPPFPAEWGHRWLSEKGFWIFTTVKDQSDPTVERVHDPANERWVFIVKSVQEG